MLYCNVSLRLKRTRCSPKSTNTAHHPFTHHTPPDLSHKKLKKLKKETEKRAERRSQTKLAI
jgi:hypothetical protein